MAKEVKTQTTPKASRGSSFLDTIMLLASTVVLIGGIFCYYYLNELDVLPRVGILVGGIVLSIGLLALTGFGKTAWQYIRGSRTELKKITWPTRPELLQTTLAVIVVVALVAVILGVFDFGVQFAVETFIYGV